MADAYDIAAAHLHDARCDGEPCYDANTEQHRFGPTVNDYSRAEALVAELGITVTAPKPESDYDPDCYRCSMGDPCEAHVSAEGYFAGHQDSST
jgi:hypothetical protein